MLITILAIVVTALPYFNHSPGRFELRVRANGYVGAMCLTVDGPEFHRSCWTRLVKDPEVRITHLTLHAVGEYTMMIDDKAGNHRVGTIAVVE